MCRRELGGVGWGFGLKTLCQILGPDVGRAARTTLIESFFVVRRGEDCQVGSSRSKPLSLGDWCGEQGSLLGPHTWDHPQCLQLPAAG